MGNQNTLQAILPEFYCSKKAIFEQSIKLLLKKAVF
jgi:hypothetical protein